MSENFLQLCILGNAAPSDIDDYIDEWHNGTSDLELHEFLGLSLDEYFSWINEPSILERIIFSHKFNYSQMFFKSNDKLTFKWQFKKYHKHSHEINLPKYEKIGIVSAFEIVGSAKDEFENCSSLPWIIKEVEEERQKIDNWDYSCG